MNKYAYTDELDKCYGLTGVVISLNVLDNEYMVHQITLDSPDGDSVTFTPDFYFSANPRYSARIAWNEMLKQYQLLIGMVTGNILSRYCVRKHQALSPEEIHDIREIVADEGHDICSLDDDEIDAIFNKTFRNIYRVFSNHEVHSIIDGFATVLKKRRTLSGDEIIEQLQLLSR